MLRVTFKYVIQIGNSNLKSNYSNRLFNIISIIYRFMIMEMYNLSYYIAILISNHVYKKLLFLIEIVYPSLLG